MSVNETITTYQLGGRTYEIDHLGIAGAENFAAGSLSDQWGEFAVYREGEQVAEFAIPESAVKPEYRPDSLPADAELIRLAREAVALNEAHDAAGEG